MSAAPRIGHGFDAHRLAPGRRLILGGVHVPCAFGAVGHSDADVLAHAVADAILGAANLGSLGELFPDADPAYKDADSLALLADCMARARAAGYGLGNLDATVVLQRPRLAPHGAAMRERLAAALGVDPQAVSVKAKTSDGLGYTGDGSGVAAYAVALLLPERA